MANHDPGLTAPQPGSPEQAIESDADAPEAATETMPSLQDMIRRLELQAQEHYDAWLRAKAEADNIRKRAQADVANAHKYAVEGFATELLPVRDALEAALAAENSTLESLRQGVELTLKQVNAAFDKFAVREVNPVGDKF